MKPNDFQRRLEEQMLKNDKFFNYMLVIVVLIILGFFGLLGWGVVEVILWLKRQ